MKRLFLFIPLIVILILTACREKPEELEYHPIQETQNNMTDNVVTDPLPKSLINSTGRTIEERFLLPDGYERVTAEIGTFGHYLRTLPLKSFGEKVHYYDGQEKMKDVYDAVVDMDIGNRDLQQCADAVMRLRAEYLYSINEFDKIHFNLTNGFKMDFSKWVNGYRVKITGNKTSWIKKHNFSDSYETFRSYMDFVFAYAGTLSLEKELKKISIEEMKIGDIFIKGGSPGHCVIIVDMAENKSTGKKLFMLAQSYMPAQDIQILKNMKESNLSPWYSNELGGNLETPEWVFPSDSLRRFEG